MSWIYLQERLKSRKEVKNEKLQTVQKIIHAEKGKTDLLLKIMCECGKGPHELRTKDWTTARKDLQKANRQIRICESLREASSICWEQIDDIRTQDVNGTETKKEIASIGNCSSHKPHKDRQQNRKSDFNEQEITLSNAREGIKSWKKKIGQWEISMNLPCSLGPAGQSSPEESLDGEPSAPSSGTPIAKRSFWPAKLTASWNASRSGTTSERSTVPCGVERSMSLPQGFLASLGASQESEKGKTTIETFGPTRKGLSKSQDQNSYGSKIQIDLFPNLTFWKLSKTLRALDTKSRRLFLVPIQSGRQFIKKESGYWPAPVASDVHGYRCGEKHKKKGKRLRLNHYCWAIGREDLAHSPIFREKLMGWPTNWTALKPLETDGCLWRR